MRKIFVFLNLLFLSVNGFSQIKDIYNKYKSSVVTIFCSYRNNLGGSLGTGFFIEKDLIVTNYHVVDSASMAVIKIAESPEEYEVEGYVALDRMNDLAILRIKNANFQSLPINTKPVETGDKVYVIGSPKGLESTLSEGIVSNKNREINGRRYFQITAPITFGSSGGPVINEEGRVIGVATGGLGTGNLNFAITYYSLQALYDNRTERAFSLSNLPQKTTQNDAGGVKQSNESQTQSNDKRDIIEGLNIIGIDVGGLANEESVLSLFYERLISNKRIGIKLSFLFGLTSEPDFSSGMGVASEAKYYIGNTNRINYFIGGRVSFMFYDDYTIGSASSAQKTGFYAINGISIMAGNVVNFNLGVGYGSESLKGSSKGVFIASGTIGIRFGK